MQSKRTLAGLLALTLSACASKEQSAHLADEPAPQGVLLAELARDLPRRSEAPLEVCRLLSYTPGGPYTDKFTYALAVDSEGNMWVHRAGGIFGISEWRGPVERAHPTVLRLLALDPNAQLRLESGQQPPPPQPDGRM